MNLQNKQIDQAPVSPDENVQKKRRNIVAPWQNVAEFEEIRDYIYGMNANPHSWKRAIEELNVWINRRRSQCPAAVFATQTLLQVKLNDQDSQFNECDLQSLYAFALIRFFNFMSSTLQTHNMRSMYNTATEMGLASFVVDLRHVCAHGTELPELLMLRRVTNYCLNWLYEYYWREQTEKMIDANGKCLQQRDKVLKKRAQEVEELLTIFDIAFECHLIGCRASKDIKKLLNSQRLSKLKSYRKAKNINSISETFDAVITDMVALTKQGTLQKSLALIFAKGFIKMNYIFTFIEHHSIDFELENILGAVQNLFRFFAVYNIVETILYQLFDFAESNKATKIQRTGAAFWIQQILIGFETFISCKRKYVAAYDEELKNKLDHNALNFGKLTKTMQHTYESCGVNLKRIIIFGDSFQRPWVWHFNRKFLEKRVKAINEQTAPVLQSLITLIKPKMRAEEISKLEKIVSTYLSQNINITEKIENSCSDKVYTLSDILCNLNKEKINIPLTTNNNEAPNSSTTGGWSHLRDDEYDWSKCPIGLLPWQ